MYVFRIYKDNNSYKLLVFTKKIHENNRFLDVILVFPLKIFSKIIVDTKKCFKQKLYDSEGDIRRYH